MSDTAVVPEPLSTASEQPERRVYLAGVLVMSFASLLLELALTRLFSVILFYHFAFLAISIALLGLGAGGVFAYVAKNWLARRETRWLGSRLAAANAVVLLAVLEIVLHTPVSLQISGRNFLALTVIYLVSAAPFFFTGLFFSVLFARQTSGITQLYAADLCGGALACVGVVPLLNWIGGPSTILAASAASMIAAAIWAETPPSPPQTKTGHRWSTQRKLAVAGAAIFAVAAVANYSGRLVDIVYAKGVRRDQPWVKFARWNAISRVEVDDQGGAQVIVIDADASTYIMNTDPHDWRPDYKQNLMSAAPSVVNVLRPRGDYAIIGPGGGVDVLRALANGSPSVTGIEINPIIVNDIMRGRWADYSFHLYDQPEVHMHVSDGRSWVRNASDQFDVVQMTLVDTWASTAAGAFALSENNLYTVEAFREYFDHLKPDGIIAITRWEFRRPREALRVVSQELEVLRRSGGIHSAADYASHFIVISEGALDEDGRPVTVLFKKSPFTPAEESAILTHLRANPQLHALYLPAQVPVGPGALAGTAPESSANFVRRAPSPAATEHAAADGARSASSAAAASSVFRDLIFSGDPRSFAARYAYDVAPVSDNTPFFFFTIKTGDMLRGIVSGNGRGMDWRINLGVVVLGMVLVISVAAVLLFLILPLVLSEKPFPVVSSRSSVRPGVTENREPETDNAFPDGSPGEAAAADSLQQPDAVKMLYFIAIGLGYILAEIAFIQRFVLFLGHPTYALTVVIFLMLLASGVGSMLSRRWLSEPQRVRIPLAVAIGMLVAYVWILPPLLRALVGMAFPLKLIVSGIVLVPPALAMGMPFPSGLRALAQRKAEDNTIEWAWALNAASSVLGSVLAMVVAIQFGLNWTLACGGAAYLAALVLLPSLASVPRATLQNFTSPGPPEIPRGV